MLDEDEDEDEDEGESEDGVGWDGMGWDDEKRYDKLTKMLVLMACATVRVGR